ncbi:MAG: VWA domain-containing protein [Promethearchaeota archaeon]
MADILGTYDLSKKVEDTVILLENTRKAYGNPDVVVEIEAGIISMVQSKIGMESASRYALVSFSNRHNIEIDFEDFSLEAFQDALYSIELSPSNVANINLGLNAAFEVLVKNMQKLAEGKQFRIIIICQGEFEGKGKKWEELLEISSKVGIVIDTVQISEAFSSESEILKTISKRTNGYYIQCKSISDIESTLVSLAPNRVEAGEDAFQSQEDKDMKGLLEVIAADLITLEEGIKTVEDLKNLITQEDDKMKCGICHSPDCMFCKGPAFSCGAFCPECGRFFHQHCCAGWAESQKDTPKTVFKCPVCFHLLKVPATVHRISVLKENLIEHRKEPISYEIKKFNINEIGAEGAYKFCMWCRNVFNPNEIVYHCGNSSCDAFYHIDCLEEMSEKTLNRCRLCDSQLGRLKSVAGIERII